jgi:hypothetical protein
MQARRVTAQNVRPIELSLRVRHPSLDPAEISQAFELEPEHCFKAGERRETGERPGAHSQTYWLAPVDAENLRRGEPSLLDPSSLQDPSVLQELANQTLSERGVTADKIAEVARNFRVAGETCGSSHLEGLLFGLLARLNLRQEFLARIQKEGGDVSVLVVADPAVLRNFNLSLPITRFLAKLNIEVEFEFESVG